MPSSCQCVNCSLCQRANSAATITVFVHICINVQTPPLPSQCPCISVSACKLRRYPQSVRAYLCQCANSAATITVSVHICINVQSPPLPSQFPCISVSMCKLRRYYHSIRVYLCQRAEVQYTYIVFLCRILISMNDACHPTAVRHCSLPQSRHSRLVRLSR
jgi:hypothetical protein